MFINNHTSVWGSWYDPGTSTWGYACCHSFIHASYCAGEAGIEAAHASSAAALLANPASSSSSSAMPPPPVPLSAKATTKAVQEVEETDEEADDRRRRAESSFSKKRVGEGDVNIDRGRLERALAEERKRKAGGQEDDAHGGGKRRKGGIGGTSEVTEEELGTSWRAKPHAGFDTLTYISAEAYRMSRSNFEDPMANYKDMEL